MHRRYRAPIIAGKDKKDLNEAITRGKKRDGEQSNEVNNNQKKKSDKISLPS